MDIDTFILVIGAAITTATFIVMCVYFIKKRGFSEWFYLGIWPYVWLQCFIGNKPIRIVSVCHVIGIALIFSGLLFNEVNNVA